MGAAKFDVIALGELNPDLIFTDLNGFPELGKEKTATGFVQRLGSSTAIAAAQMAKLGLQVAMVSKVGKDSFGRFCRDELERMGVDTSFLIESEQVQTGLTVSMSYPEDRMLVTYLGGIAALKADEVKPSVLRQGRHLHVSSFYLQAALRPGLPRLFQRAKELGLTVSLDTGDDPAGKWADGIHQLLEHVDIFFPSKNELLGISGEADITAAVRRLGEKVPVIAVKLGSEGSLLYNRGEITQVESHAVPVLDTTGAGDSFDAGFIYGYLSGYSLPDCLKVANACGALCTTAAGGPVGFDSAEAALQLAGLK